MLTTTLPASPDRTWLAGFWLAGCTLAGAAASVAILAVGGSAFTLVGILAAAVALAVAGLRNKRAVLAVYRVWNGLARRYSAAAHAAVLAVCHTVLFVPVGWAGSRLPVGRRDAGGWAEPSSSRRTGGRPGARPMETKRPRDLRGGWGSLAGWALESGQAWLLFLLPFLMLLRSLSAESTEPVVTDIYTLY